MRSHSNLPGPLAKGNDSIDSLLIAFLTPCEFHQLTHINTHGLMNKFQLFRQEARDIVSACPTYTLTHHIPTTIQGLISEAFIPTVFDRLMLLMSLLLNVWELFMFLWILIRT